MQVAVRPRQCRESFTTAKKSRSKNPLRSLKGRSRYAKEVVAKWGELVGVNYCREGVCGFITCHVRYLCSFYLMQSLRSRAKVCLIYFSSISEYGYF